MVIHEQSLQQAICILSYRPERIGSRHRINNQKYGAIHWTTCMICTFSACSSEKGFSEIQRTLELIKKSMRMNTLTDENRFTLSSNSECIYIWRERGTLNNPTNITENDRFGSCGVLVWEGIMFDCRADLHILEEVPSQGLSIVTKFFFFMKFFQRRNGPQFLLMELMLHVIDQQQPNSCWKVRVLDTQTGHQGL